MMSSRVMGILSQNNGSKTDILLPLGRFWSSEFTESSAQKFLSHGAAPTVSPSIFSAFDETIGRPRVRWRFVRLDCQDLTVDSAPICANIETVFDDRLEPAREAGSVIRSSS